MITYTCYPKYIFFGDLILVYTFMVITILFLNFGQAQGSADCQMVRSRQPTGVLTPMV
jgi:hypothetical protein